MWPKNKRGLGYRDKNKLYERLLLLYNNTFALADGLPCSFIHLWYTIINDIFVRTSTNKFMLHWLPTLAPSELLYFTWLTNAIKLVHVPIIKHIKWEWQISLCFHHYYRALEGNHRCSLFINKKQRCSSFKCINSSRGYWTSSSVYE